MLRAGTRRRRLVSWAVLTGGIVYAWAGWVWATESGLALWQLPFAIYFAMPFLVAAVAVEGARGSRLLAVTVAVVAAGLAVVCAAVHTTGIAGVALIPPYALIASVSVWVVSRRQPKASRDAASNGAA